MRMTHGIIVPFRDATPRVAVGVYIAPNATLIGSVVIGRDSSVWFGAVLRGDFETIRIGERSNVQDRCVVHVDTETPTTIGDGVTVGHSAVIHGCALEDGCLIGARATILDHAVIGREAMIGAGAVVGRDVVVGPRELWVGAPARRVRALGADDLEMMARAAANYVEHAREYRRVVRDAAS